MQSINRTKFDDLFFIDNFNKLNISKGKNQENYVIYLTEDKKNQTVISITNNEDIKKNLKSNQTDLARIALKIRNALRDVAYLENQPDLKILKNNLQEIEKKIDKRNVKIESSILLSIFSFLKSWFTALPIDFRQLVTGFKRINEKESVDVLNKTQFVSYPSKYGINVDRQLIEKNDLQPVYFNHIHGTDIYFSKVFEIDKYELSSDGGSRGHQWVIAYIKGPGDSDFQPRAFYRSRSQNLWRATPALKESMQGAYLHKGFKDGNNQKIEASINLPWLEICLPLNRLVESNERAQIQLEPQELVDDEVATMEKDRATLIKASKIAYGVVQKINNANDVFPDFQSQVQTVVSPFTETKTGKTTQNYKSIYNDILPNPAHIKLKTEKGIQPDFTLAQRFDLPGAQSSKGVSYVVPSQDLRWRYVFYVSQAEYKDLARNWKEVKARPNLAAVEYVGEGQGLTNFGSYKIITNPMSSDIPGVEYSEQIPAEILAEYIQSNNDFSSTSEITSFNGEKAKIPEDRETIPALKYWPTWKYRCHLEILKNFQKWLNIQSS